MKLIHHVKKHWKTITLHLKKHHKKYIFWILSATLLWKWVSLIAAYAVVHNLSFSFADTLHQWEWDKWNNWIVVEETITDNEQEDWNQEDWQQISLRWDDWNIWEWDDWNNWEWDNWNNWEWDDWNNWEWDDWNDWDWDDWNNWEWDDWNNWEWDDWNNWEWDDWNDWDWNWTCDRWDIIITSPIEWDIVWGIFDIEREFTNNDCQNDTYTIKLRDQNDQYLAIYSWDTQKTWFTFDSTQLITEFYTITWTNESWDTIILHEWTYEWDATNHFSWHKLSIVSDEWETIYRIEDWWKFTIDNKKPEISNINIEYSTENEKLSIWDTITIIFESDEELKDTTVNILGQYANLEEKVWNKYKYSMDFSEENTIWKIVYWIKFKDEIWNEWYIEWYDNRELDYTKPTISDLKFTLVSNWKIKITFKTNKKTDVNLIYQMSGTEMIKSINDNWEQFNINLDDIVKIYRYNYSISIQDQANNTVYIWWNFYISWNEVIFTNSEIQKSDMLTNVWFKKEDKIPQIFTNTFGTCTEWIRTKDLKVAINKYKSVIVKVPEYNDWTTKKTANAFIAVLFEKIENKNLSQHALDEITEDLNNFLIVVKLVKDNNNQCKQNMTQYYINRFKNTLEKHGIIK